MFKTTIQITDLCLDEISFPITKAELISFTKKRFSEIIHELEKISERVYFCRDEIDEELDGPPGG